jgi:hypothetical protein
MRRISLSGRRHRLCRPHCDGSRLNSLSPRPSHTFQFAALLLGIILLASCAPAAAASVSPVSSIDLRRLSALGIENRHWLVRRSEYGTKNCGHARQSELEFLEPTTISEEEEEELFDHHLHHYSSCSATSTPPPTRVRTVGVGTPVRSRMARGGGAAKTTVLPLTFWENMICGAVSRSVAQTVMHPANTMKTILQSSPRTIGGLTTLPPPTILELASPRNFRRLSRGAGANFLMSIPHGAVNFAVLEFVRQQLTHLAQATPGLDEERLGAGLDFLSSCISTISCSIVSTPQMVITDNIMAGNYPNMVAASRGLASSAGLKGFYRGWWPGLVGKIPSYALTWTFFQQAKLAHARVTKRAANNVENSILGSRKSSQNVFCFAIVFVPCSSILTPLFVVSSFRVGLRSRQRHHCLHHDPDGYHQDPVSHARE